MPDAFGGKCSWWDRLYYSYYAEYRRINWKQMHWNYSYIRLFKQTIGTLYKKVHISDLDYESFKDKLLKRINIPIFTFTTVMNTDVLVELITDYFSEPKGILE